VCVIVCQLPVELWCGLACLLTLLQQQLVVVVVVVCTHHPAGVSCCQPCERSSASVSASFGNADVTLCCVLWWCHSLDADVTLCCAMLWSVQPE
jgi:hypothetical protein